MAIPDRRYCFDFYRPMTELSEWLDALKDGDKACRARFRIRPSILI